MSRRVALQKVLPCTFELPISTTYQAHPRLYCLKLINASIRGRSHAVDHRETPRRARPGVSTMNDPSDFHDAFNGGATSTFDEPDALYSFWDELNEANLTRSCPQSTGPSAEPYALQQ